MEIGQRVECTDKKSTAFGKQGVFEGFLANAWKVTFDDGGTGLFLACDLKKVGTEENLGKAEETLQTIENGRLRVRNVPVNIREDIMSGRTVYSMTYIFRYMIEHGLTEYDFNDYHLEQNTHKGHREKNGYTGVWVHPSELLRAIVPGDLVMMETLEDTLVVEVSAIKEGKYWHANRWVIPQNQIVAVKLS